MEPGEATRLETKVHPEASDSQNRSAFAGKLRQHREVFWNLPNTITMLRIAAVPIMLFIPTAWALTRSGSRFMGWVFILAALSDILDCLLYTSPSPRDATLSRMPSSA